MHVHHLSYRHSSVSGFYPSEPGGAYGCTRGACECGAAIIQLAAEGDTLASNLNDAYAENAAR